jgi:hypothetical protein
MDNADLTITCRQNEDFARGLLRGYRFSVCETREAAARAIEVRRQVYVNGSGYQIPVPDDYDARSWFLLAEDMEKGLAVGSMRITPRLGNGFEAEEYMDLPPALRSSRALEINRFAILPEYRKGKTFLPTVSLGLFKLVVDFGRRLNADSLVICSKAERIWTYEWLNFRRTGIVADYGKLGNAPHELLVNDFPRHREQFRGHPFEEFMVCEGLPEVVPRRIPSLGLVSGQLRRSA